MENKKLIRSQGDMKLLIQIFGKPPLPQGEYELSASQSLWELFHKLKQGKDKDFLVSFPEGLNHYEMAEVLRQQGWPDWEAFLKEVWNQKLIKKILNKKLNSLEGYLFPSSYRIKKYMKAQELIQMMCKEFLKVYKPFSSLPLQKTSTDMKSSPLPALLKKKPDRRKKDL